MKYAGGKNLPGVAERIINLIPRHRVFVEPFLGSGAVMRKKRLAEVSIGVDLDAAALAIFGEAVPGLADRDGVTAAACYTFGEGARAARMIIIQGCGIELLEQRAFDGSDFVYCDPPSQFPAGEDPRAETRRRRETKE